VDHFFGALNGDATPVGITKEEAAGFREHYRIGSPRCPGTQQEERTRNGKSSTYRKPPAGSPELLNTEGAEFVPAAVPCEMRTTVFFACYFSGMGPDRARRNIVFTLASSSGSRCNRR